MVSQYINTSQMNISETQTNPTLELIQRVTFFLSLLALAISVRLIRQHLTNFSQPIIQRKIIAILWMVPIYSITSWLSLTFVNSAIYLDMIRDCYESFVIYMFFALCYCYIGQIDRDQIDQSRIYAVLAEKHTLSHLVKFPSWTGIQHEIDLSSNPRAFLLQCKENILQFVLVKPLSTITAIILSEYFDLYEPGNFALNNGYIYITSVVNISISLSMYWLVMFYQATKESLMPFSPVPKFLCIKGVLFFSYWQSVVITILVKLGIIQALPDIHYSVDHVAATVQNSLICLEMVGFAFSHSYAFPADPFFFLPTRLNSGVDQPFVSRASARAMISNAVNFSDMVDDFNEVAPEIPLVRFLRRNSTILSANILPRDSPDESTRISVPSEAGLAQLKEVRSKVLSPQDSN